MTTIDGKRRPRDGWTAISTTHRCERHLIFGDRHCGKRARWRNGRGLIACGGCKQLAVRAGP